MPSRRTAPSTSSTLSSPSTRVLPRFTCAITSRAVAPPSKHLDHARDQLSRRKRLLDEEVLDPAILGTAQEHDLGAVDGAPRAADLLVVGDHRARRLVVHDEAEVRLVVAHPERARRHHGLELVGQQPLLDLHPPRALDLAAVGLGRDPAARQPVGHQLGVALGERVDDPRARELRQARRQPREPLGAARQVDDLEPQARPPQRAAVGASGRTPRAAAAPRCRRPRGRWPSPSWRAPRRRRAAGRASPPAGGSRAGSRAPSR